MAGNEAYHEGMRRLQDLRETRPLADRLEEVTVRSAFTAEDRAFLSSRPMMFVATADAQGNPECSYKGGLPGFVRVVADRTLAFPDYAPPVPGWKTSETFRDALPARDRDDPERQRKGGER